MSAPSATAGAALPTPSRPSASLAIVVLALLLSIQPVTTDLYLPALPALTRDLGASVAAGQLTLSALLLAFGCSQLVWGPLSDRFGRRPVLLAGLGIYAAASVGSALAPSMALLVVWRVLQGAAMGAVVMCARAIVRDLYTPLAGARAMSKALTGLGIVACLCAPVGGLLAQWLGWRAALLALTAYATAHPGPGVACACPKPLPQAQPPGPAARHAAAHLAPGAGPPQLLGLLAAHHGHLWRSVHLPRRVLVRVHRSAAAHPHALRLGDVVHQRGLLLRHLCVPLPAGAAGAAPLGGHCRGL